MVNISYLSIHGLLVLCTLRYHVFVLLVLPFGDDFHSAEVSADTDTRRARRTSPSKLGEDSLVQLDQPAAVPFRRGNEPCFGGVDSGSPPLQSVPSLDHQVGFYCLT